MNGARHPPPQHPLAEYFDVAVDSIGAALHADTLRHYRGTARKFLTWLGHNHPALRSLDQLQRNPHILGWLAHLQSQTPPLGTASCINVLIHLRGIFHELAPGPNSCLSWPICSAAKMSHAFRNAFTPLNWARPHPAA
jgi:hypothetical protein